MGRIPKRITELAVMPLLLLLCLMLPVQADAATVASGNCSDTLTWVLEDNATLTISGEGPMKDYTGTAQQPWSSYQDQIRSVVVEDTVTHLGAYAFAEYENLECVTIGSGVKTLGNYAFYHCRKLNELNYNAAYVADLDWHNHVLTEAGYDGEGISLTIGSDVQQIPDQLCYPNSDIDRPKITRISFQENSSC